MDRAAEQRYLGVRYAPGSPAARRGHVESYFLKVNDPKRRRALWLKATIYATRRPPQPALAETWAIAFDGDREHVAVKTTVPYEPAQFARTHLDVAIDGVVLKNDRARGAIESGARTIAWDLALTNDAAPLVHFAADWMYERALPSSKLVSPFPDLRASGSVVVNGETWVLDAWPGLLGHNWGPRHAPLYAWGHCNVWENADPADAIVLEGVSGRMKLGPLLSPITTILCLRYRGVRYELNAARALATNRAEISPRRWTFAGGDDLVRIDGEMWGETDDFVGLHYQNPDSTMTHCLNSKLARARVTITLRDRPPLTITSHAAALEIGTMRADHGVRMYV